MSGNQRVLRSTAQRLHLQPMINTRSASAVDPDPESSPSNGTTIKLINLGTKLPGLTPSGLQHLRKMQTWLSSRRQITLSSLPTPKNPGGRDCAAKNLRTALRASLAFAQPEAGSAVCIDGRGGWLLTCAHCFGDSEAEYAALRSKRKWLLFYDGVAVQAECRVWDGRRDLALLKIVAVEMEVGGGGGGGSDTLIVNADDESSVPPSFHFVQLASSFDEDANLGMPITCIGQPGAEDLESATARQTGYDIIHISEGRFRGLIPGADPQDNSEIGTLKHDAWTYWGHSGAPLLRNRDAALIGLHSSWDDQTAMRHGVPLAAISAFLNEHEGVIS
ncbi:hypothetical protein AJ80_05782 [Polytolypa hystricis UAMH7299]|uniref:AT hook domain-containing protein family protein n=1 Tax=Polytolypa hystricis (strain UAMH7299) TaxID=1447883 RepID=A0A2B7Y058_POLH7|nr:hypothetical protein AJ80_05782 [Polytolypa hystricis UAMH7299]